MKRKGDADTSIQTMSLAKKSHNQELTSEGNQLSVVNRVVNS